MPSSLRFLSIWARERSTISARSAALRVATSNVAEESSAGAAPAVVDSGEGPATAPSAAAAMNAEKAPAVRPARRRVVLEVLVVLEPTSVAQEQEDSR